MNDINSPTPEEIESEMYYDSIMNEPKEPSTSTPDYCGTERPESTEKKVSGIPGILQFSFSEKIKNILNWEYLFYFIAIAIGIFIFMNGKNTIPRIQELIPKIPIPKIPIPEIPEIPEVSEIPNIIPELANPIPNLVSSS